MPKIERKEAKAAKSEGVDRRAAKVVDNWLVCRDVGWSWVTDLSEIQDAPRIKVTDVNNSSLNAEQKLNRSKLIR